MNLRVKSEIIGQVIEEITTHQDQFDEPCPLRILALKFHRKAERIGGLKPLLRELESDGTLEQTRLITGAVFFTIRRDHNDE